MANASSSYLQHLPEMFRARPEPDVEPFLGRFLKIFEALLSGRNDALPPGEDRITGLEDVLARFSEDLDPALTPVAPSTAGSPLDSPFLSYLASWVALALDQNWDLAKRRQWVKRIVSLYQRRGTRGALDEYLAMFVGSQAKVDEPPGGFVLGKVNNVKQSSTVGVDTFIAGAPAYYFRVRINYGFGADPFDIAIWRNIRQGTRAIVDLEKPAHTYYRLDARTPGIIVARRGHATVGYETLIWQSSKPA